MSVVGGVEGGLQQGARHAASEFIAFAAKVKHKTTSLSYVDSAVCLCMLCWYVCVCWCECVCEWIFVGVGGRGETKPKQCFCARVANRSQVERINNVTLYGKSLNWFKIVDRVHEYICYIE